MILSAINVQSIALPDRNLLVVLGDDASLWYSVQQSGSLSNAWLPLRSQNRSGFTQVALAAHPRNGALIAALSAELTLWWQTVDSSLQTWSGWDMLGSPKSEGGLTNLVASIDAQGDYAAVAIGIDGAAWLIRQTAGQWGEWSSPGVPSQTQALIDVDLVPTIEGFSLIGLGLDNAVYEIEAKSGGQWGEWHAVGIPAGTHGLYQMTLISQPKQTTLFATSLDAELWTITKNKGSWQQWVTPGQPGAKGLNVDLVLDSSGLIHAFCIGDDKAVLHLTQTASGWSAWEHLPPPPPTIEFTAVSALMDHSTQSLHAYALDASGGVWGSSAASNAPWGAWLPITLPEAEVMRGVSDFFNNPPVDFEPPDPSLRYDQAAFLVSHNAYASHAYKYLYSQQALSITHQLERGVRGLMLDIFENCEGTDGAVLAHRSCEITKHMKSSPCETLTVILGEIKAFLDANPEAVITLLCESYVGTPNSVKSAIDAAGLNSYLFHPNRPNETHKQAWSVKDHGWPTLRWMIENNRRLVIFSQRPQGGDDGLPTQWDYCVETTYGKLSMGPGCDCRTESLALSDTTRPIFVMNRFPTLSLTGSLLPAAYATLNDSDKILNKIMECATAAGRLPNFLAVDFVEQGLKGGPFKAINELNRRWLIHIESLAQKSSA